MRNRKIILKKVEIPQSVFQLFRPKFQNLRQSNNPPPQYNKIPLFYDLMRADDKLAFLELCPIPTEEELASDAAKLLQTTEGQEPSSPIPIRPQWPSTADISGRLRKIFTQWQRFVRMRVAQKAQQEQFNEALSRLDPQILQLAAGGQINATQLQAIVSTGGNSSPQLPAILQSIGVEIPGIKKLKQANTEIMSNLVKIFSVFNLKDVFFLNSVVFAISGRGVKRTIFTER